MALSLARSLTSRVNLTLKSRCLTGHISCRFVQEFPPTRFDNSSPKDYLLILPEKLNETDNESLRIPQQGEPEINFSKLNAEICFRGLSQALCTFENFLTDVNNQVTPPYSSLNELLKDVEKHLVPMDSAYNILMIMRTIKAQDYAHKEIYDLFKRYYEVREKRFLGPIRDSLRSFALGENLDRENRRMLKIYQVNTRKQSTISRPYDDSSVFHFQKNLQSDIEAFNRNLFVANQSFTHTIDDPDILVSLSNDFNDYQDLHHKERTPLQITTGTYHKFMKACPDRFVRQRMWQTFNRRCSPKGLPRHNNALIIKNMRVLKRKLADFAGYRSHLEYRLEDTMAASRQRVMDCLDAVNKENSPKMYDRLQELTEFAYDNKHEDPTNLGLQEYDIDYWSNRYVHDILIGINETDLKNFFPFKKVMNGLSDYFKKFLSVDMKTKTTGDNFWSNQVQIIEVTRKDQPLGTIIYDPFYRSAMNPYESIQARLRCRAQGWSHLPARLVTSPFKMGPSKEVLLSVNDVLSLFYLFSSTIQRLLYNYQYFELNTYGLIEQDVKDFLPSLCLSHIQTDHKILQSCSSRSGTKPIDTDLAKRILRAMNYFKPFNISKELYKAHLDQESHVLLTETKSLAEEIHPKYSPFPRDPDDFDFCAMGQIFVGPNDGLQYSNLWSRQVANFCLSHNLDSNGDIDESKIKELLDKVVDDVYRSGQPSFDEKLTALVGKRFEPAQPILGML